MMLETSKVSSSIGTSRGTMGNSNVICTELTLIDVKSMRFIIMDAPRPTNVHVYIKEMTGKYHVTDVVRVCEPTYPIHDLNNAGITVHEMEYKDGSSPSTELIISWLQLVERTFFSNKNNGTSKGKTSSTAVNNDITTLTSTQNPCIAVHCIAGLGRAPVMVAIALIEFGNMDSIEAVSFIRSRRRGAINNAQIQYLSTYKKQYHKYRHLNSSGGMNSSGSGGNGKGANAGSCGCVIM